jgi:hypothetical protein
VSYSPLTSQKKGGFARQIVDSLKFLMLGSGTLARMRTRWCGREWCKVAALADAHRVINKPKAKKERIFISSNENL